MPKARIASSETFFATRTASVEEEKKTSTLIAKRIIGGVGIVGAATFGLGLASSAAGEVVAKADKCFVVGGATDPTGDMARGTFAEQGQLNNCNDGVENVWYPAEIGPFVGSMPMKDAVAIGRDDLVNRLNNTPDWQRKHVFSFSEGTEVAAQAGNATTANNVVIDLNGGPQGRTGVYQAPVVNILPIKPILDLAGIPTDTPLNERPGLEYVKKYNKSDGFANLAPQGLDPFALISLADGMVNRAGHRIPAPDEPIDSHFTDGDGIENIVTQDGSPFTRSGIDDPAVMNPNPLPEIPPLFYGLPPIGGGENPLADIQVPNLAPAAGVAHNDAPSFYGEAPCQDPNGGPDYYTDGDLPC